MSCAYLHLACYLQCDTLSEPGLCYERRVFKHVLQAYMRTLTHVGQAGWSFCCYREALTVLWCCYVTSTLADWLL